MPDQPPNPKATESTRQLLGKLWTQTQQQAGRAARYGRDMLALRQLRNDRERMVAKLGKEVRQLVEGGEIDHPGLVRGVGRLREIEGRIRAAEEAMRAKGIEPEPDVSASGADAEAPASEEPPAEPGK